MKVRSFFGQKSVWVGGFQQSGPLVEKFWSKTLQGLPLPKQGKPLRNVLILGLGCGSVIKPLLKKFPNCKITGIEIDPEMIEFGRQYFNLGQYTNLEIICDDAVRFCKTTKRKYDLVLVDMYKGNIPEKTKINISKLLNPGGKGIINVLSGLKNKAIYIT